MPTNNQFQLTFPDGWEEITVYTYKGPDDSGVQHNIVLTINPNLDSKTELADFVQAQLEGSTASLPAFEMLGEETVPHDAGVAMCEVVYRYKPADEVTCYQKQYYLIIDGKGYIFTSTFSKKTLRTIAHEVDAIVRSLLPEVCGDG